MTYALTGLRPADGGAADWALRRMGGREGVALIVPDAYPAVVRIMHRLTEYDPGETYTDGHGAQGQASAADTAAGPPSAATEATAERQVRWGDVLPQFVANPKHPGFWDDTIAPYSTEDGVLSRNIAAVILPLLTAATRSPDDAYFGMWAGHGGLNGGEGLFVLYPDPLPSAAERRADLARIRERIARREKPARDLLDRCPLVPWWGARDAHLLRGPLTAIGSLGHPVIPTSENAPDDVEPLGPLWWFPADHAWFLGTEIDDGWSYLAGPRELIDGVLALSARGDLEAFEVSFSDPW